MSNGQDLVLVARADLERVLEHINRDVEAMVQDEYERLYAAVYDTANPSVTVEGESGRNQMEYAEIKGDEFQMIHTITGAPFGPCTVTITPKDETPND